MKEYYYLTGKEQNGPFTFDDLKTKDLTSETLIWTAEMKDWQKIKDCPELLELVQSKATPPPPPMPTEKVATTNQALKYLIIWSSFHLFALITSYSRINVFHSGGKPQTSEFWPFVKIVSEERSWSSGVTSTFFHGIFYNYDWSEFTVYVGGALVIFAFYLISKKEKETQASKNIEQ